MKSSSVIKVENVVKKYTEDEVAVKAVNDVSFEIEYGEFTAIVGPSGSGKTTLLNVISGLDNLTKGKVWLKEKLITEMSGRELSNFRRDNIGFIFQAYNLIPVLNVEENIEYIMLIQGMKKNERHEKVMNILDEIGLKGYEGRLATKLSGGQQQRVAIARAMVSQPVLIFADEPTANLDSKTGEELLDMMRQMNQKTGMTFIFSTHDEMIMKKAKRIITLRDGKITGDEIKK